MHYLIIFYFSVSRTLLIPVDGSQESTAAFDYAVKNSKADDTLLLFHGEPQALSPSSILLKCLFTSFEF
jgi:hypothetical protein